MKRFVFSFLLFAVTSLCSAEQALTLWFKNGDKMLFSLEDNIKTTFGNGDINITSDVLTVSYSLSDVQKYTYRDSSDGISTNINDEILIQIKDNGNIIDIYNLIKGSTVDVYTTDGKRVVRMHTTTSVTSINITEFDRGIYICQIGGVSFKFIKS